MHVDIACHHTTLTAPLREAVLQKLSKLDHHTDAPLAAHVVLTVEPNRQVAEATVHLRGAPHHAKAEAANLYDALDQLVTRLDRVLRKSKTRRLQRVRSTQDSLRSFHTSTNTDASL